MLFSLGNFDLISKCCKNSFIGYKYINFLLVYIFVVLKFDFLLWFYEGCVNWIIGRLNEVIIVKFYYKLLIIFYLFYFDFDMEVYLVLCIRMNIDLWDLSVSYEDYKNEYNLLILYRKDVLVILDYFYYEKFIKFIL